MIMNILDKIAPESRKRAYSNMLIAKVLVPVVAERNYWLVHSNLKHSDLPSIPMFLAALRLV